MSKAEIIPFSQSVQDTDRSGSAAQEKPRRSRGRKKTALSAGGEAAPVRTDGRSQENQTVSQEVPGAAEGQNAAKRRPSSLEPSHGTARKRSPSGKRRAASQADGDPLKLMGILLILRIVEEQRGGKTGEGRKITRLCQEIRDHIIAGFPMPRLEVPEGSDDNILVFLQANAKACRAVRKKAAAGDLKDCPADTAPKTNG